MITNNAILKLLLTAIFLGIFVILSSGLGAGQNQEKYQLYQCNTKVPRQPYLRYYTYDSLQRKIDFYLSEVQNNDAVLPLVIYIHGSGGSSHFYQSGQSVLGTNGHNTINDVYANKARLLIVEKPGVEYLQQQSDSGLASDDYLQFRKEHTLDRWVEAIHAAIEATLTIENIHKSRILIIGHSEGGIVVSKLSADYPNIITHTAVLAGGGPTQLYDLRNLAESGSFFRHISEKPVERVEYLNAQWEQIQTNPTDYNRFFFGHPFNRWATFLKTSTMEQLAQAESKIFIAQGTADNAVVSHTAQVLYTHLLSKNKTAELHMIDDADHSFAFVSEDKIQMNGWRLIHEQISDWFLTK